MNFSFCLEPGPWTHNDQCNKFCQTLPVFSTNFTSMLFYLLCFLLNSLWPTVGQTYAYEYLWKKRQPICYIHVLFLFWGNKGQQWGSDKANVQSYTQFFSHRPTSKSSVLCPTVTKLIGYVIFKFQHSLFIHNVLLAR